MYRIHLSTEQREDLRCLVRQTGLAPSTRERLEMVRLSDAGWSILRIARYLGQHEQTVRAWIKAFLAGGFAALSNKPRGGKQSALTPTLLDALRAEIAQGQRTWTAAQAAAWLAERSGVRLSVDRVRVHLKRAQLTYQRTSVAFIWQVAQRPQGAPADWRRERPLRIVLDNYSVHKSQTVAEARAAWTAAGIELVYLPSYCLDLSAIEPIWNDTKQHYLPTRSFSTVAQAKRAVDDALAAKAQRLQDATVKTMNVLRRAA